MSLGDDKMRNKSDSNCHKIMLYSPEMLIILTRQFDLLTVIYDIILFLSHLAGLSASVSHDSCFTPGDSCKLCYLDYDCTEQSFGRVNCFKDSRKRLVK